MSQTSATTNLDVVTASKLEHGLSELWEAMKSYVQTQRDTFDTTEEVKRKIIQLNGEGALTDSASAMLMISIETKDELKKVLTDIGYTPDDLFQSYPELFKIATGDTIDAVTIHCGQGQDYTADEWNAYVEEHGGEAPGHVEGIAVRTPAQEFLIAALQSYPSKMWGAYNYTVPYLPSSQTGSFLNYLQNSLVFAGLDGTLKLLLYTNPQALGAPYCLEFDTYAELAAYENYELPQNQVYVVKTDEVGGGTNICYTFNGEKIVKRFAVPLADGKVTDGTGSPLALFCWQHKHSASDTRQWFVPTINHCLIMTAYYSQINACLSAVGAALLPTGYTWVVQQGNATNAYYVTIPTGSVSSSIKYSAYAAVPVTAL